MWMRRKLWLIVPGLVIVVALLFFEYRTRVLRGSLNGEPFYRARPASYWRCLMSRGSVITKSDGSTAFSMKKGQTLFFPHGEQGHQYWQECPAWVEWLDAYLPRLLRYIPQGAPLIWGDTKAQPVLQSLLEDDDAKVRQMAAGGLRALGVQATSALPALRARLGDPDAEVRKQVQAALREIEPRGELTEK
jgi:hypothetical protein